MKKLKFYFNSDKEVEWLNEMSRDGWALRRFFMGVYTFEPCEKGRYLYQLDLHWADRDYRRFMQDLGVQVVCSWGPWCYLEKEASEGSFEMYTDDGSKIAYYKKIRLFMKAGAAVELMCMILELIAALFGSFTTGYLFAAILGILGILMTAEAARLTDRIHALQGLEGSKRGSPLLPAALLLNSIAILIQTTSEGALWKDIFSVAAASVVLIAVGIMSGHILNERKGE